MIKFSSSYRLKSGERPGDGITAPCGNYSGIYTADYEYVSGLGDLDECNGRTGVTPEYPEGTYYYVITDIYPFISRCLTGTPSNDFKLR
ncbi:MAG: YHYH protein [Lewinellaceae bacterium]|nr:YHYH protein [Lewinellaceae bacterium]